MPVINQRRSVNPAKSANWRPMRRIDSRGGNVNDVANAIAPLTVLAEGDSWFDKFTPLFHGNTNLLDLIRTPFGDDAAVVDVSHIGDGIEDMVSGRQARQTRALLDTIDFRAILLSAGGNDVKNVFARLFEEKARKREGLKPRMAEVELLDTRPDAVAIIEGTVERIREFVKMRDESKRSQQAPIFLHGYDYLQPRPAGASIFAGSGVGGGPWLYPVLAAAGLTSAEMLAATRRVIDRLNELLQARVATLDNVHVFDQRGVLVPAAPESGGDSNDWLDEIHPNAGGFAKLARDYWEVPLALKLGWQPAPGDIV